MTQQIRFFYIKGTRNAGGMHFRNIKPIEAIVALLSDYSCEGLKKHHRAIAQYTVDTNGSFLGAVSITAESFREATESEIELFNNSLAEINLCFKEIEFQRTSLSGKVSVVREICLSFARPEDVKYLYKGNLLSKDEVYGIELTEGMAFLSHYDNGYSYESVAPITKEQFISMSEDLIAGRFTMTKNGVELTKLDDGSFAVYVRTGKAENWSQTSNT